MASRKRQFVANRFVDGVMVVILVAGVLKAADVTVFAQALATWEMLPPLSRPVLAIGIPALEIGVSLAWLLGVWRTASLISAVLIITVFTVAYGLHLALAEPPECGCLGFLNLFQEQFMEDRALIVRNSILVTVLVVAGLVRKSAEHGQKVESYAYDV